MLKTTTRAAFIALAIGAVAAVGIVLAQSSTDDATPPATVAAAPPPPLVGARFPTRPAGAGLPSAANCARRVRRSAWEPRPGNRTANRRQPRRQPAVRAWLTDFDAEWNRRYRPRISGKFRGTTDEIIQWAACKWGLGDNLLRAQAWVESSWRQGALGDLTPRSEGLCTPHDRSDPCPLSFGLLQTKWIFHRPGYPMTRTMTAFHLDWSAAQLRGCLDGHKQRLPAGDLAGCVGNWFSGSWRDPEARAYVARVRRSLRGKPWRRLPHQG